MLLPTFKVEMGNDFFAYDHKETKKFDITPWEHADLKMQAKLPQVTYCILRVVQYIIHIYYYEWLYELNKFHLEVEVGLWSPVVRFNLI